MNETLSNFVVNVIAGLFTAVLLALAGYTARRDSIAEAVRLMAQVRAAPDHSMGP